jgi:uncharacterized protein (UPF0147 family)
VKLLRVDTNGLEYPENIKAINEKVNRMQTQSEKVLKKNGRPKGSLGRAAIKRNAVKVLEEIASDPSAPPQARADAAIKLVDIL